VHQKVTRYFQERRSPELLAATVRRFCLFRIAVYDGAILSEA
jgi:hypothetical protein